MSEKKIRYFWANIGDIPKESPLRQTLNIWTKKPFFKGKPLKGFVKVKIEVVEE